MNVLLISDGYRSSLDDRLRIDFVKKLSKFCNFKIYGPKEYGLDSNFAPVEYDDKMIVDDICKIFDPDVILFLLYKPSVYRTVGATICKMGIPTVIREEDHYYKGIEYDNINIFDWYRDMNFTLLLRQHFYEEEASIPSVWTPTSANEKEFNANSTVERKLKIGFAGSFEDLEYYNIRRDAIETLRNNSLSADTGGKICGDAYIEYLHKYVGGLSCSGGRLHTCLSKTFEIPLCGTAVLTNWMHNKRELFGDKQCFFEYKDDCSDLVDVANTVINDVDMRNEVVSNAIEVITERHTDEKRILEYYNILQAVVDGKEPPRIWGQ